MLKMNSLTSMLKINIFTRVKFMSFNAQDKYFHKDNIDAPHGSKVNIFTRVIFMSFNPLDKYFSLG